MWTNQTLRRIGSLASGAGTFVLLYIGLGAAPLLVGCDAAAGALAGASVWYLWPVISKGRGTGRLEPTVENIEAKLPELRELELRLSDDELRTKVEDNRALAIEVLEYLKDNPSTAPPEASILLMKNVESTIDVMKQYLLLPKLYDETTSSFARMLDSACEALGSLLDSLCRHDADGFARACEVVEQTLKALDTLLPVGRRRGGDR